MITAINLFDKGLMVSLKKEVEKSISDLEHKCVFPISNTRFNIAHYWPEMSETKFYLNDLNRRGFKTEVKMGFWKHLFGKEEIIVDWAILK